MDAYARAYGDDMDAYIEEILADAYAGMNRTDYGTNQLRTDVQQAVADVREKMEYGEDVTVEDLGNVLNAMSEADAEVDAKVNSAYTKKNPAGFITSSEVMFADEKRAIPLLRRAGLTIASQGLLRNGYVGSIAYEGKNVKLKGVPFTDVAQAGQKGDTNGSRETAGNGQVGQTRQRAEGAADGVRGSAAQQQRVDAGRKRAEGARTLAKTWDEVTVSALGLGEDATGTVRVMPEGGESASEDIKRAVKHLKAAGVKNVKIFAGQLTQTVNGQTLYADAAVMQDGTVLIRADSAEYSAFKLAKHESYHILAKQNPAMAARIRTRLLAEGKITREMIESYVDAYTRAYGDDMDAYIEEILADAYAGMNRTDYGTNQLRADVQLDVGQWKKKTGSARAPPAKYSMVGRGENGLKTYKSDFSSDMTIEEKKTYMYRLITEAWDKKPIDLTILEDGKERKITARFDGETNGEKFAGKMAHGNRRGNRTERLITLNLANDIWEIANESTYDNSKDGSKQTRVHDGTERWSYFTNAINYVDDAQPNRNGVYDFNLDVMRREDGDFVYTFYLKKRRTDAPRTFAAGVDGKNAADAGSSKNSISKTGETVKGKFSASAEQASEKEQKNLEAVSEMLDDGSGRGAFKDAVFLRNPKLMQKIIDERGKTQTAAFRNWFAGSRATNTAGEPLLMFHGAGAKFTKFDAEGKPIWLTANIKYAEKYSTAARGFDRVLPGASVYAGNVDRIIPAYIRVENPADVGNTDGKYSEGYMSLARRLRVQPSELKAVWEKAGKPEAMWRVLNTPGMVEMLERNGYDGIRAVENGVKTWAVFSSTQVKSAVANNGSFSLTNPDIRYSAQEGRYRDLMGEKPAKYVRQLEARLVNELAENLSVPGQARREVLRPIAEDALRTFFTDGQLDRAKLDELFETAYDAAWETNKEYWEGKTKSFKDWQRANFTESIDRLTSGLRIAQRYLDAQEKAKETSDCDTHTKINISSVFIAYVANRQQSKGLLPILLKILKFRERFAMQFTR